MDFLELLKMLGGMNASVLLILSGLGTLVVIGQAVVALTPSQSDDAAWEKIKAIPVLGQLIVALASFAPIQKK